MAPDINLSLTYCLRHFLFSKHIHTSNQLQRSGDYRELPAESLPLIKSSHCSCSPSKHSQTVIFSLFAPEIENSQLYHQRPSLLKPNLCIFITFSICAESGAEILPPFPPLHWPSLSSLCIPSSNQQTGCQRFASMLWAKVTFSLLWHSLLRLGPLILKKSGFSAAPLTLITDYGRSPCKAWSV